MGSGSCRGGTPCVLAAADYRRRRLRARGDPPLRHPLPSDYSRFLALFHIASDKDGDGTIAAGEYFGTARFLGVLDTKGDWYDEEAAEYEGQKE